MRDPELLISLLQEMSETVDGQIHVPQTLGMSEEKRNRIHQIDLLVDAGHATWQHKGVARITNDGYDFLNAIDKQPAAKERFLELFNNGATYIKAALEAINIATRALGVL